MRRTAPLDDRRNQMRYMLAIFGEEGGWEDISPEDMKAGMKMWSDYSEATVEAGAFIAGEGLEASGTATTVRNTGGDGRSVTDGPFAETKEQLGGFYLLECENLDEALEWAKKIPVREGGSVEVRPVMDYTKYGAEDPATAEAAS
jgi:hypothetical protein